MHEAMKKYGETNVKVEPVKAGVPDYDAGDFASGIPFEVGGFSAAECFASARGGSPRPGMTRYKVYQVQNDGSRLLLGVRSADTEAEALDYVRNEMVKDKSATLVAEVSEHFAAPSAPGPAGSRRGRCLSHLAARYATGASSLGTARRSITKARPAMPASVPENFGRWATRLSRAALAHRSQT